MTDNTATPRIRLAVLGSTRGTVLQALIDAIADKRLEASIEIVISNRADAYILERARRHDIKALFADPAALSRRDYDAKLTAILQPYHVDLILLIGYMRILSPPFVRRRHRRILNIHPSLLPRHAKLIDKAVHRAVLTAGDKESGCTVHYVTEQVDAGAPVLQGRCPVLPDDTVDSLRQRVQALEGETYIEAVRILQRQIASNTTSTHCPEEQNT